MKNNPPQQSLSRPFSVLACVLLLAFTALLFTVPSSHAGVGRAGKVVALKRGKLMRMTKEKKWEAVSKGGTVYFGDRIKTGKRTIAIVKLPGKGRFVIGPQSDIRLGMDKKEFNALISEGSVWVDAAKLSKGSTLKVRSPQVTTGVRGTKFSVLTDKKGGAVCTCEGLVDVIFSDSEVIQSPGKHFVEIGKNGEHADEAKHDLHLLRRKKKNRYKWCFECHEAGGKGKLKRNWNKL